MEMRKGGIYMITFIIGLAILFVGAALYGKFCEKVFGPDDRKHLPTPNRTGLTMFLCESGKTV